MGDFSRMNLYGQFAICKDHIAREKANSALEKVEQVETAYNNFKERNSYLGVLSVSQVNTTIKANTAHNIPISINKNSILPESSKLLLCIHSNITDGDLASTGDKKLAISATCLGRPNYNFNNDVIVPSGVINNQTFFCIVNIDTINSIFCSIKSNVQLTSVNCKFTVIIIPIASEVKS